MKPRARKEPKLLYVPTREEWRAWLQEHHETETEIWLVFPKKHTGQTRVPYEDAVEEDLCFGWIDSIARRIDDDRYAQKFTPRKDTGNWSAPNLERMERLIADGKMTPAGLAKFEPVAQAKKEETRQRRLQEALRMLESNQKLGLK